MVYQQHEGLMHKVVNGVIVELSAQEEQAITDEWAANEIKLQNAILAGQQKKTDKQAAIDKIATALSLTETEKNLLFGN